MRQHVIHERMKYWAMALLLAATSGCAQHTAPTDHLDTGVSYANYMDPSMHAADNVLGVKVYPYTFFIGPRGEMLGRVIGTAVWDDARVVAALEAAYRGDSEALAALTRR